MNDRRVIACNMAETTNVAPKGALAYVQLTNPGGHHDRIVILVRSHSSRWVSKWEAMRRLTNFRIKTLPPEHPLYDCWPWGSVTTPEEYLNQSLEQLRAANQRERAR